MEEAEELLVAAAQLVLEPEDVQGVDDELGGGGQAVIPCWLELGDPSVGSAQEEATGLLGPRGEGLCLQLLAELRGEHPLRGP